MWSLSNLMCVPPYMESRVGGLKERALAAHWVRPFWVAWVIVYRASLSLSRLPFGLIKGAGLQSHPTWCSGLILYDGARTFPSIIMCMDMQYMCRGQRTTWRNPCLLSSSGFWELDTIYQAWWQCLYPLILLISSQVGRVLVLLHLCCDMPCRRPSCLESSCWSS